MRILSVGSLSLALVFGMSTGLALGNPDPVPQDPSEISEDYLASRDIEISRPTFNCAKTRWPQLGAMICAGEDAQRADWELAGAYWASYFSKFGQDRAAFRNAHVKWAEGIAAQCSRKPTKADASACVARAYQTRAALYRNDLRDDALAEAQSPPAERLQIQEALARAGHLEGSVDGVFGASTRTAIIDFQSSRGENATGFLTDAQKEELGAVETGEAQREYEAESDEPTVESTPPPENKADEPASATDKSLTAKSSSNEVLSTAQPSSSKCSGALAEPNVRELAERADSALGASGQNFRYEDALDFAFDSSVRRVMHYPSELKIAEIIDELSPEALAACLPNYAKAMYQVAQFEINPNIGDKSGEFFGRYVALFSIMKECQTRGLAFTEDQVADLQSFIRETFAGSPSQQKKDEIWSSVQTTVLGGFYEGLCPQAQLELEILFPTKPVVPKNPF